MKNNIRIMIVEDNPEYREVVSLALETATDIELTGQFGTAERALRNLQESGNRDNADLLLLDLNLPGMSGQESIRWFKEYAPDMKIIILTQSDMEADVLAAISAGANGYLLKSSTLDQIIDGIRTVINGGASLDANVARFILNTLQTKLPTKALDYNLSDRELEILTLLGDGLPKREIGDKLDISYSTVDTHVCHIYGKLQVKNAPAAISKAYRTGILPTGDKG